METPIFIVEGNDMAVYRSVDDAQRDIETPDVEGGTYEGFDAQGRRLTLAVDGLYTRISLAQPEVNDADVLESKLRHYLSYLREEGASESQCDLPCLIELSLRHAYEPLTPRDLLRRLVARVVDAVRS